jgi:hypothetical protein
MRKGKFWNLKVGFVLLVLASFAIASVEYTYTDMDFNIDASLEFTVTLPGESAVTSLTTGAVTTGIEFNASTGSISYVNCTVVGSATAQDANTPCFNITNTGTVGFELNVSISAALPSAACDINFSIAIGDDWQATPWDWITPTTSNQTVNVSLGTGDWNEWWAYANFSGCVAADSTSRQIFIQGSNLTT